LLLLFLVVVHRVILVYRLSTRNTPKRNLNPRFYCLLLLLFFDCCLCQSNNRLSIHLVKLPPIFTPAACIRPLHLQSSRRRTTTDDRRPCTFHFSIQYFLWLAGGREESDAKWREEQWCEMAGSLLQNDCMHAYGGFRSNRSALVPT
jgi:hypothetical protein